MSNKLITDAFPKTKKEKQINQKFRQTKPKSSVKPTDSFTLTYDVEAEETRRQKELAVLKDFDLNPEYGPCIGITRQERWDRADKYGLHPPEEVREILQRSNADMDTSLTECIWYDAVI